MSFATLTAALLTVLFSSWLAASAQAQAPPAAGENAAIITQIGEEQRAAIAQRNIHGGVLTGAIRQNGAGNEAALTMEGGNLSGSIVQEGIGNSAALEIADENNRGAIEQYGEANAADLRIGGHGQDVTLIQHGSVPAANGAISVRGDAPAAQPITIRQY